MQIKYKPLVYGISLIATLGGFLFGYDTAVISGAVDSLNKFFVLPQGLPESLAHSLLGFIVSAALIGCIIGSASGGYFSQLLGRKKSLLLAAILFTISGIGSAIPELGLAPIGSGGHSLILPFIIYRIMGGIGIGLASIISPMYIAEVSPAAIRGRLVSWNQLAIVSGILAVYFVNYYISLQGDAVWNQFVGWRWMFASSAFPGALFFVVLWFIPESPRWLVMKGKESKALHIFGLLNGKEKAEQTLASIRSTIVKHSGKLLSFGFFVLAVGIMLSAFQQLVGIQVMMYYAPEIFKDMGQSSHSAMFQTILVGSVNFIFTVVAIYSVDKFGRKPLLLIGSGFMSFFMLVLGLCFFTHALGVISLICVLGFVGSFSFSWGPVTWVLLSEIFPNSIRSKAMSLTVAVQWITNYTVSSTFPLLDKNTWLVEHFNHSVSFWLFGVMSLLSFIFVWRMIPETKGKSLEQMEDVWRYKRQNAILK
jgi:SP family xylose:H+ symportor-like MFS transporter